MFATISAWCLALTIGQAQAPRAETDRLDAIPDDVQIVARLRGLQQARDDLSKMLEASAPNLSALALPTIDGGLTSARQRLGETLSTTPVWIAVRLSAPGRGDSPKIAVLTEPDDYAGMIKALRGDAESKKTESGADSFPGPNGMTWFAREGTGFHLIGNDEKFLAEIARTRDANRRRALSAETRKRLTEGELGLYFNLGAIQKLYGEQIGQARETLSKRLEGSGEGNPAVGLGKAMTDMGFKAFESAESLTLSIDFSTSGLIVSGDAALKKNSEISGRAAASKGVDAAGLGKLPATLSNYSFLRAGPGSTDAWFRAGASLFLSDSDKKSESYRKASALMREAGPREAYAASVVNLEKPLSFGVTVFDHPQKAVEAVLADVRSLKETQGKGWVKNVEVASRTTRYRGFELREVRLTLDLGKFADLAAKSPVASALPKPSEKNVSWFGTDGKRFLNVGAPTWDEAKSLIDSYLDGKETLAAVKGFQQARKLLPAEVGALFLFQAQSLIRDFAKGMAIGMGRKPNVPELPDDPVFIAASAGPTGPGYHFRLVVPNDVGPVIERGILPVLQGGGVRQ